MYLATIIVYISILVWLLPPFRQLKGGYFLYFLLLGYSDPLGLFLLKLYGINLICTHLVIAVFLTLFVIYYNNNLNITWIVILCILCFMVLWIGNKSLNYFSLIFLNSLIFIQILIPTIKDFYFRNGINLYYSVLLLYELGVILKYIVFAYSGLSGIYLFYLTSAFEILIGLFFIFYNLNNSPFIRLQAASNKDIA